MIQATQLKKGMCIKHDNDLWRVVEAQHKTPGNLRGFLLLANLQHWLPSPRDANHHTAFPLRLMVGQRPLKA